MTDDQKRVPVAFFRTNSGREPVRDWLKALDQDDRRIVGNDLQTLEYGWLWMAVPTCALLVNTAGDRQRGW